MTTFARIRDWWERKHVDLIEITVVFLVAAAAVALLLVVVMYMDD